MKIICIRLIQCKILPAYIHHYHTCIFLIEYFINKIILFVVAVGGLAKLPYFSHFPHFIITVCVVHVKHFPIYFQIQRTKRNNKIKKKKKPNEN